MGKLTYTARIGLAKKVLKFIESHRTQLIGAGLNPDKLAKTLKLRLEANVTANDAQEKLKADLKKSTTVVVDADREMYVTASGYIDAMSGALMKDSASSKVLVRLRSKAKMGPRPPKVPTPQ
jgi:hypothetical protein